MFSQEIDYRKQIRKRAAEQPQREQHLESLALAFLGGGLQRHDFFEEVRDGVQTFVENYVDFASAPQRQRLDLCEKLDKEVQSLVDKAVTHVTNLFQQRNYQVNSATDANFCGFGDIGSVETVLNGSQGGGL